ncbi:alanyl-tRNA editing protein [Guggenheimella bovis]
MTEKLFHAQPYTTEFDAEVIACTKAKGGFEVVLDRSFFFPLGGGQLPDRGVIGGSNVLDVTERDGVVFHLVESELPLGPVHASIDWDFRYDMMQQHSGEHIISGLVHKHFGFENVGFSIGEDVTRIDYDGVLSDEDLRELEDKVNRILWRDVPILESYPTEKELETLDFRSKKELAMPIRIITINDVDICACCGTHLRTTGEIGFMKILTRENYKGGTRLTAVFGRRATKYYDGILKELQNSGALLSSPILEVRDHVEKLNDQLLKQKERSADLERMLVRELSKGTENVLCLDLSNKALQDLARNLRSNLQKTITILTPTEGGVHYFISSDVEDVRPLQKGLNEAFLGRGGGREDRAEGLLKGSVEEVMEWMTK